MSFIRSMIVGLAFVPASLAASQTVAPEFADSYSVFSLGAAPGVPVAFGGLMVRQFDPNTLLLGGLANHPAGAIYAVALARDGAGHIEGWGCTETQNVASAPHIDGGLCMGPQGQICYTGYPINVLGQILPGEMAAIKITNLTPLGISSSVGAMVFVPEGFPGAGRLKMLSYNANQWFDVDILGSGDGTFDITSVGPAIALEGGVEGATYIAAGNPHFPQASVLVSCYGTGTVLAYTIDANGDPITSSRRVFITGLNGAEGAVIDPLTGDFLFSTFGGGNAVVRVSGFTKADSCIGNLTADQVVDGADLGTLLASWGECPQCPADLDGNCIVDGSDLGVLLGAWGPCD